MVTTEDRENGSRALELSVILVFGGQRERAAAALRSVLEQSAIDRMEILLFDLGPSECPPLIGSDDHRVRTTRYGPDKLLGDARAEGVRSAKAPVVALLEEHCVAQPGWAETMIRANEGPWAAVGCDFVCANPDSGSTNQTFRLTYGAYIHQEQERGPVRFVAGQNSTFKRDILLQYDNDLESLMMADLVLQWKMMEDGHQLFYEPDAKIAHRNENTVRSLCGGAFYWNWCFANIRARVFHWGFAHKALIVLLSPLIPWVRLAKKFVVASRQGQLKPLQFLRDAPSILAVDYASAAGQVAGLLNKIDIGIRKFSHFELNEPRYSRHELA